MSTYALLLLANHQTLRVGHRLPEVDRAIAGSLVGFGFGLGLEHGVVFRALVRHFGARVGPEVVHFADGGGGFSFRGMSG